MFQVDVFHAFHGGADPTKLIERYKGRVPSLHLKDLKRGLPVICLSGCFNTALLVV
jgi:sugar phosphate isomerase/epimerase